MRYHNHRLHKDPILIHHITVETCSNLSHYSPPRLTAARPGFIKSIAAPHPPAPSSCSPVLTKPAPGLSLSSTPVTIQSAEHSTTGELEHLPDQYFHSIGCPLSWPAPPPFVLWILQRGLPPSWTINCFCNIDTICAFFLKSKILRNILKQSIPLYQKVQSVPENSNLLEGQSHLTASYR